VGQRQGPHPRSAEEEDNQPSLPRAACRRCHVSEAEGQTRAKVAKGYEQNNLHVQPTLLYQSREIETCEHDGEGTENGKCAAGDEDGLQDGRLVYHGHCGKQEQEQVQVQVQVQLQGWRKGAQGEEEGRGKR